MALPIVYLTGTPYEQGVQHGRELRDRIAHNLALYFARFESDLYLPRAEVLAIANRFQATIEAHHSDYFAGMQGVADGSGHTLEEIAALNMRYEIFYYRFGKIAMAAANTEAEPDGCTAFAVLPEATEDRHLLMGQNWDWIPEVQGAVLHTTDADGFKTAGFTEAGIVGAKIGLNAVGIGLAINGMTSTTDDLSRMATPFHVRCYQILRARTFDDALAVITDEARNCSTNFLVAQAPNHVADVEAAPDAFNIVSCTEGCLTHANHFIAPDSIGVKETPSERIGYSWAREARLRKLLLAAKPVTVEKIQDALRDTENDPFGVCRHRDLTMPVSSHYTTVTSVVMDLETRTLHLTDGTPDIAPYQTVTL